MEMRTAVVAWRDDTFAVDDVEFDSVGLVLVDGTFVADMRSLQQGILVHLKM